MTPRPKSTSGRIVAYMREARRPVSTREIAELVGVSSAQASAFLNQLRCRGNLRQLSRGSPGRNAKPATWAIRRNP